MNQLASLWTTEKFGQAHELEPTKLGELGSGSSSFTPLVRATNGDALRSNSNLIDFDFAWGFDGYLAGDNI